MDEQTVPPYAEAHAKAIADGDTDHAGADLDESLRAAMAGPLAGLAKATTSAEVLSVEPGSDAAVVLIQYSGPDSTTTIRSVWKQVGDRPLIVEAAPV